MNDKEKELWRVIDNVIKCCAIELPSGELSITREDVLGKSRAENLVMTRCMVVELRAKQGAESQRRRTSCSFEPGNQGKAGNRKAFQGT